jgi:hypothetical protein
LEPGPPVKQASAARGRQGSSTTQQWRIGPMGLVLCARRRMAGWRVSHTRRCSRALHAHSPSGGAAHVPLSTHVPSWHTARGVVEPAAGTQLTSQVSPFGAGSDVGQGAEYCVRVAWGVGMARAAQRHVLVGGSVGVPPNTQARTQPPLLTPPPPRHTTHLGHKRVGEQGVVWRRRAAACRRARAAAHDTGVNRDAPATGSRSARWPGGPAAAGCCRARGASSNVLWRARSAAHTHVVMAARCRCRQQPRCRPGTQRRGCYPSRTARRTRCRRRRCLMWGTGRSAH